MQLPDGEQQGHAILHCIFFSSGTCQVTCPKAEMCPLLCTFLSEEYNIKYRIVTLLNVNWTILSSKPLKLITIKTFLASGIFEYLIYHP